MRKLSTAHFALLAALCLAVPATAQDQPEEDGTFQVRAQVRCEGGQLTGLHLFVPVPGVVTVPIPANVCAGDQERSPQKPALSGLSA